MSKQTKNSCQGWSFLNFLHDYNSDPGTNSIATYFGIDLRVLACLRILIGILVLIELIYLWGDIPDFYSASGVLPNPPLPTSLHQFVGSPAWSYFLFVAHALFSILMAVGFRTRITTFLTWFMTVLLYASNPFIVHRADNLLCVMLLWIMFVPTQARFSIDAIKFKVERESNMFTNIGTVALILQIPIVYFFSGLTKLSSPFWWPSLHGVYFSMKPAVLTEVGRNLLSGLSLRTFEWLAINTLAMELIGPLLLFVPLGFLISKKLSIWVLGLLRIAIIAWFTSFQIFLFFVAEIGLFPFVSLVSMLPLLPPFVIDFFSRRIQPMKETITKWSKPLKAVVRGTSSWILPPTRSLQLPTVLAGLCTILLLHAAWSNLQTINVAPRFEPLDDLGRMTFLKQNWDMFSNPVPVIGFHTIEADLINGKTIDIYQGGPIKPGTYREEVREPKPLVASSLYDSYRWRLFMVSFRTVMDLTPKYLYGRYVCTTWNKEANPARIHQFSLKYYHRPFHPEHDPERKFQILKKIRGERGIRTLMRFDCKRMRVLRTEDTARD